MGENWFERTIREAQERGLFDNLEGRGRPINWEDESLIDDEWLMAFRIMREHGFAPQWIELHREIGQELNAARQRALQSWHWYQERLSAARGEQRRYIGGEWGRARAAFVETVAELNKQISDFNLMVPIVSMQKFKIDPEQELAALGIDR
jgi:hypothetical protein